LSPPRPPSRIRCSVAMASSEATWISRALSLKERLQPWTKPPSPMACRRDWASSISRFNSASWGVMVRLSIASVLRCPARTSRVVAFIQAQVIQLGQIDEAVLAETDGGNMVPVAQAPQHALFDTHHFREFLPVHDRHQRRLVDSFCDCHNHFAPQ